MSKEMASIEEYKAVANVAADYIEAVRIGSIDILSDIFHKDAVAYGTVDGKLVGGGSVNPAVEFIKKYGKSPEIDSHITVLDITPTTAVVRVIMEKDAINSECNGNLIMVKLDTGWKIVAKVFHQF